MFPLLALLFVVLPLVELYLIIQASQVLGGALNTIAVLVIVSMIGAWLVRREGFNALARAQQQISAGKVPTDEMINGILIAVAGALLLTPGFLTDTLGVVLLVPPSRAVVRDRLRKRYGGRIQRL